ncbi:MAG: nitrous oxide reductase accessory protein NosL [Aquificaceae bacterium]
MKKLFISALLLLSFSLAFSQPKEPPKGERCVICGMDVNTDPRLTSQLKLKDGSYKFSLSPKHAIQYYLENEDKTEQLWVKDYESGKWIDGTKAFYVAIKEGPMGYDLAAFQSRISAQRFAQSPHSAKNKVYQLKDIDKVFLEHLDMGHVH